MFQEINQSAFREVINEGEEVTSTTIGVAKKCLRSFKFLITTWEGESSMVLPSIERVI